MLENVRSSSETVLGRLGGLKEKERSQGNKVAEKPLMSCNNNGFFIRTWFMWSVFYAACSLNIKY